MYLLLKFGYMKLPKCTLRFQARLAPLYWAGVPGTYHVVSKSSKISVRHPPRNSLAIEVSFLYKMSSKV
jgi:hypothetical protein